MSNIDVLVEVCVSLANEQNPENLNNSKRQRLSSYSDSGNDIEVQPSTSSISSRLPYRVNLSNNDDSSSEEDIDNEDQIAMELLVWQEAQISRCIVDNSVNQALESYLELIGADQAMNYESDIEESAISVAIDEYGLLQQMPDLVPISPNGSPDSSLHLANESTPRLTNTRSSSSSSASSTSSTSDCQHKSDNPKNIANESAEDSDHDNVMEAAITAAIQKKGLASYR